jgi:hypothetical protein
MGLLDRFVGVSLGKVVFLRITLIKLHSNRRRGVPSGAATFIVFGGKGASAPKSVMLLIYPLPRKNSDEPKKKVF